MNNSTILPSLTLGGISYYLTRCWAWMSCSLMFSWFGNACMIASTAAVWSRINPSISVTVLSVATTLYFSLSVSFLMLAVFCVIMDSMSLESERALLSSSIEASIVKKIGCQFTDWSKSINYCFTLISYSLIDSLVFNTICISRSEWWAWIILDAVCSLLATSLNL